MTINLLNKHTTRSDSHQTTEAAQAVPLFPNTAPSEALRPQFWTRFQLETFNHSEWEALCDGCGSCCLIKYIDNDDDEELVEYTDVTCQLMDCTTGYCKHYATRQEHVPDCIQLTIENLPQMMWLPSHCAYKRLYKGQNLPSWHLLLTQDTVATQQQMRAANIGVAGRCVSETGMSDEEMETRVVNWVKP